jgi:flagellar protein FlaG
MVSSVTNSNASQPVMPQPSPARAQAQTPVQSQIPDAAAHAVAIKQAAQNLFSTKNEVSSDMQRIDNSIEESINKLSQMLKDSGRSLNIGVDKALGVGSAVITVRSADSGEVIRVIPNEVVVKLAHSIEAFKGWLKDVRV